MDIGTKGKPDLVVVPYQSQNKRFSPLFFLVEVKSELDNISQNQINWWKNHPDVPIKLFFINQIESETTELHSLESRYMEEFEKGR